MDCRVLDHKGLYKLKGYCVQTGYRSFKPPPRDHDTVLPPFLSTSGVAVAVPARNHEPMIRTASVRILAEM